jgi:hypothetical protein
MTRDVQARLSIYAFLGKACVSFCYGRAGSRREQDRSVALFEKLLLANYLLLLAANHHSFTTITEVLLMLYRVLEGIIAYPVIFYRYPRYAQLRNNSGKKIHRRNTCETLPNRRNTGETLRPDFPWNPGEAGVPDRVCVSQQSILLGYSMPLF